jgi:hypothetical protein
MKKYKHLVNRQDFLNMPGHHAGAYVRAYVEDTKDRDLEESHGKNRYHNFEPRMVLEIADCSGSVELEFDLYTGNRRQNSFHKIDTLIEALQDFREGLVEESTRYKRRQHKLDSAEELQGKDEKEETHVFGTFDEFLESLED